MASRLKLLNNPAKSPQQRGRHHKNVSLKHDIVTAPISAIRVISSLLWFLGPLTSWSSATGTDHERPHDMHHMSGASLSRHRSHPVIERAMSSIADSPLAQWAGLVSISAACTKKSP